MGLCQVEQKIEGPETYHRFSFVTRQSSLVPKPTDEGRKTTDACVIGTKMKFASAKQNPALLQNGCWGLYKPEA